MGKIKLLRIIFPVFCAWMFISACTKTEYIDMPPQLKIIVKTLTESPVANAKVDLFENLNDFTAKTNPIKTGLTDENGTVLFSELNETLYFFFVELNEKSNQLYVAGTSQPLETGVITIVETYIN